MDECAEITVIMKDEERTLRHSFLCYEGLHNMELIRAYVKEAKENFPGAPDTITVKTTIVIQ